VLVGTVLTLLSVDLALVFGLFAILRNFIPSPASLDPLGHALGDGWDVAGDADYRSDEDLLLHN
jgi:hypothetical protein